MEREIKFRGKRKLNGDWVYGSLITVINEDWDHIVPVASDYDEIVSGMCRVIRKSIGQFIGLKDKNGKEIYEGDFIRIWWSEDPHDYTVHPISYSEKYCYFMYKENPLCELRDPDRVLEVIGNIYETPQGV